MQQNNSVPLSVLLPAFNAEKYLERTLYSILNQTFTNFELLASDDGSKDNTRAILNSFAQRDGRIKVYHNDKNIGKTATVNNLFGYTKGEFITIHDADDESLPSRFEIQIKQFENNPSLVLCGTNFITVNMLDKELSRSLLLQNNNELKTALCIESQFHGPTMMFPKKSVLQLGHIYRKYFKDYNEDYDLSCRLSDLGEVKNCSDILYKYRITPGSLSRNLTIQKRISVKLVQFLARQRQLTGSDDLMIGRYEELDTLLKQLSKPYIENRSLLLNEQAALDFYNGFTLKAINHSLQAILKEPLNFRNYRLLQHIIRKKLIGI